MDQNTYVENMEKIAKALQDIEGWLLQIHSYVEQLRGLGDIKVCVPYDTKVEEPEGR